MKLGILGNRDSWYVAELFRAAAQRGHICQRLDYRGLMAAEPCRTGPKPVLPIAASWPDGDDRGSPGTEAWALTELDAVLVRTMPPGSLEQVVFRMDVLARLEDLGILVVNPPKAIECAVDKYLATARLSAADLPVPDTVVCQDTEAAMNAFCVLGTDVVVKPLFGAEGRGIVRVSDPDLAFRTFRTLERLQCVLYLQRFIEHGGYDIRVLVLDGAIVGAMKRRSESDFRTNVARSAVGETHCLLDHEADLAAQAVSATGALFAGVDLIYDREGTCYVLEVNAVPGWRAFQRVTGIDLARHLLSWLEGRCLQQTGGSGANSGESPKQHSTAVCELT